MTSRIPEIREQGKGKTRFLFAHFLMRSSKSSSKINYTSFRSLEIQSAFENGKGTYKPFWGGDFLPQSSFDVRWLDP